jgi:hypothetical protein
MNLEMRAAPDDPADKSIVFNIYMASSSRNFTSIEAAFLLISDERFLFACDLVRLNRL